MLHFVLHLCNTTGKNRAKSGKLGKNRANLGKAETVGISTIKEETVDISTVSIWLRGGDLNPETEPCKYWNFNIYENRVAFLCCIIKQRTVISGTFRPLC